MKKTTINPARIKSIRAKLRCTQAELAEKLCVTRDAVASWEIGRSRPSGPAQVLLLQLDSLSHGRSSADSSAV